MSYAGRVGEYRRRTARNGLADESPAVRGATRQRGEQVTGLRILSPQRYPGDPDVGHHDVLSRYRLHLLGQRPQRMADGVAGTQVHGDDTVPAARPAIPSRQVACSVSGGPGSGDSGTFSRCSNQDVMLWNSGAAVVPRWPSAVRCGLSIMTPTT